MKVDQKNYFILILLLMIPAYIHAMIPNTVVATINTGVNPAGIAITPNSRFALVANSNNAGVIGGNSVSVLNLTSNVVEQIITDSSFNQPFDVAINPNGTRAFVTNSNGTTVSIIDLATNTVTGVINGFDGPSGIVVSPTNNIAFVSNFGGPQGVGSGNGNTVRVVDLNTNTIIGSPIVVGRGPTALAISPDGQFVFSVNSTNGSVGTGTVSVIQTSNNTVVDTISGFSGPFDLAVTPDGNFAFVTNFGNNNFMQVGTTVSDINLNTDTIVGTIDVGIQPSGIAITPNGNLALVTNFNTLLSSPNSPNIIPGQGTVNIIDLSTNEVIAPTIVVGDSPSNIAITPNGNFALVSNFNSNTVSVIALQAFQIMGRACRIKNESDNHVNKIVWSATGLSLPVSYSIFRDATLTDLAGVVPATMRLLQFVDHAGSQKVNTYFIVGTNAAGIMSDPVAVPVKKRCKSK